MTKYFRILAVAFAMVALVLPSVATADKMDPPAAGKMKKLKFPDFKEFKTDAGMEVIVVEQREQPVVTMFMVVRAGSSLDPVGKESLAAITADQINKGTTSKDALELADWIESVGGSVNSQSSLDWSAISITILSEYAETAYEYLRDVLVNPTFPEDEFQLAQKQAKTGLEFELSNPAAMAQRHLRDLVYGDHPYAKQPTVASIESMTRDDVEAFYKKNYVASNYMLFVVGDTKWKKVRKSVETYFADIPTGEPARPEYVGAPDGADSEIFLYHRPGAVQTEVYMGHRAPRANDPDWPAITVANRILGGGSDARLFMNLREERGWTYGAYSSFDREIDYGIFDAHMAVRTEVTDSAVVECLAELNRIRDERVTDEDLMNAKNYLIGNFPIQIETPGQIAARVGQYKLLGLGQQDLEEYRDRLAAVGADDVQRTMNEHLHPDKAYYVLVGDATEIQDKVAVIAPVNLYDIAGDPLTTLAVEPVDYEYDTSTLKDHTAQYAVVVQEMAIGELDVKVERKGDGEDDVVSVQASITGMISMEQKMEFSGTDLAPISYNSSMQVGPQTMGSEFAFTEEGGTGTVKSPEDAEPKEVAFQLVAGTIMDGTVEYAVSCLPLEPGKSYRFPAVDAQTGTVQNVTAEILELVDVTTEAGDFKAYKVRVKRPDGEAYLYFDEKSPHILVKQEVPAMAMTMELKSKS